MEWVSSYSRSNKDFIEYVMQCSDGHYLVSGRSNDSAYIAKIKNPAVPVENLILRHELELSNPNPNPVNSFCMFYYSIPSDGFVKFRIVDAMGRIVDIPFNNYLRSGKHPILLNGSKYTQGLYFCQLIYNNNIKTVKMLVVR